MPEERLKEPASSQTLSGLVSALRTWAICCGSRASVPKNFPKRIRGRNFLSVIATPHALFLLPPDKTYLLQQNCRVLLIIVINFYIIILFIYYYNTQYTLWRTIFAGRRCPFRASPELSPRPLPMITSRDLLALKRSLIVPITTLPPLQHPPIIIKQTKKKNNNTLIIIIPLVLAVIFQILCSLCCYK